MSQPGTGARGAPGAPGVRIYADIAALSAAAAEVFVDAAQAAIAARGRFYVALSGGSTPRSLYQLLASPPYRERVAWARTFVFWGDERCVPPDHPESNYRMAREALLFHVPVPHDHVFRMEGEVTPPDTAAARYEQAIRRAFALGPAEQPHFDLVLLGLGPDGHTASLFPHTPALRVTDRLVVANTVEKLQTTRLTLTAPAINHAALVVFLVAGADKAAALAGVLEGPHQPDELPAQLIAPTHGEVLWLVDRAAAADLRSVPPA